MCRPGNLNERDHRYVFERKNEDGIKADRKEIDWDDGSLLVVKIFQCDLLKGD